VKIDNTSIKTFQDCPLKFHTRHREHWTGRFRSAALGFGGAVHEGLKAWYQGDLDGLTIPSRIENAVEAIKLAWPENMPYDDYRTMARAQEMMIRYIKEYPSENFKVLQVEVPFKFELGRWILWCKECLHESPPFFGNGFPRSECQQCGAALEPIEYGGIFDTLTQFGVGSQSVLYVLEHKTTSQLGPLFFRQFDLDNQVSGYCWAGQQVSGRLIGGANINALCLTNSKSSPNFKFDRAMIGRNPTQIENFKNDVASTCNEIARCERTGIWRMHTNHCHNKYGLCEYHSVHILSDPDDRRRRLETDYRQEEWDFESRDDVAGAV
jgi:hypothetical protein